MPMYYFGTTLVILTLVIFYFGLCFVEWLEKKQHKVDEIYREATIDGRQPPADPPAPLKLGEFVVEEPDDLALLAGMIAGHMRQVSEITKKWGKKRMAERLIVVVYTQPIEVIAFNKSKKQ